jgi:dihydropteroate synthase
VPQPAAVPGLDLVLGSRRFGPADRVVMAIINRTRDSFYDNGRTFALDAAIAAADRAVFEGAAIVDIGGVKAGVGPEVSAIEEIRRVVPVVEAVRDRHPDVVISVDTWRGEVAHEAVRAGADLLNDAWGGVDPELISVAATSGCGLVCTHTNGIAPRSLPVPTTYVDLMGAVVSDLRRQVSAALAAGVRPDSIVIDPGHDFGKDTYQSLEITRRLGELVETRWPVLVAVSRKDFIGETLDRATDARLAGTLAAVATCAMSGARLFRAHDVGATTDVLRMLDAVEGRRPPAAPHRGLAQIPEQQSAAQRLRLS